MPRRRLWISGIDVSKLRRFICHCFIEDILIYLINKGNHMNHLRVVLQVHKKNQLFSKYSKCEFLIRSVAFIGHINSSEGVEVYPRKTEAIMNFPRPLTHTH